MDVDRFHDLVDLSQDLPDRYTGHGSGVAAEEILHINEYAGGSAGWSVGLQDCCHFYRLVLQCGIAKTRSTNTLIRDYALALGLFSGFSECCRYPPEDYKSQSAVRSAARRHPWFNWPN